MNGKTVVLVDLHNRIEEMTYKEYRREWGPGVCECAPHIKLKNPQTCVIHNEPMYFFGNPYGARFGVSECISCVKEERDRRFGAPHDQ